MPVPALPKGYKKADAVPPIPAGYDVVEDMPVLDNLPGPEPTITTTPTIVIGQTVTSLGGVASPKLAKPKIRPAGALNYIKEGTQKQILDNPIFDSEQTQNAERNRQIYYDNLVKEGYSASEVEDIKQHGEQVANIKKTLPALDERIKKNPEDKEALYLKAIGSTTLGEYEDAAKLFKTYLTLPEDQQTVPLAEDVGRFGKPQFTKSMGLYGLGYISDKKGKEQEAIDFYKAALEDDPQNENAYKALASHAWKMGNKDLSKQLTQAAATIIGKKQNEYLQAAENEAFDEDEKRKQQYNKDVVGLASFLIGGQVSDEFKQSLSPGGQIAARVLSPAYNLTDFYGKLKNDFQEGAEKIKQSSENTEQGKDPLTENVRALNGMAQMGFGVVRALSPVAMAAFDVSTETAQATLPENITNMVLSAPTVAMDAYTTPDQQSELQKQMKSMGDVVWQLALFHYGKKGIEGVKEGAKKQEERLKEGIRKYKENQPLTSEETKLFVDAIKEATPEETQKAIEKVAEANSPKEFAKDEVHKELLDNKRLLEQKISAPENAEIQVDLQEQLDGVNKKIQKFDEVISNEDAQAALNQTEINRLEEDIKAREDRIASDKELEPFLRSKIESLNVELEKLKSKTETNESKIEVKGEGVQAEAKGEIGGKPIEKAVLETAAEPSAKEVTEAPLFTSEQETRMLDLSAKEKAGELIPKEQEELQTYKNTLQDAVTQGKITEGDRAKYSGVAEIGSPVEAGPGNSVLQIGEKPQQEKVRLPSDRVFMKKGELLSDVPQGIKQEISDTFSGKKSISYSEEKADWVDEKGNSIPQMSAEAERVFDAVNVLSGGENILNILRDVSKGKLSVNKLLPAEQRIQAARIKVADGVDELAQAIGAVRNIVSVEQRPEVIAALRKIAEGISDELGIRGAELVKKLKEYTAFKVDSSFIDQNIDEILPGYEERGFVTRVREDVTTPEYVAKNIEGVYEKKTNVETIKDADAYIEAVGEDGVLRDIRTGDASVEARVKNAAALILADKYWTEGATLEKAGNVKEANALYDKGIELGNAVAEAGTKIAQGLQVFSIWGKSTPSAMIRLAKKTIDAYNKAKKANLELSAEDMQTIGKMTLAMNKTPEGFLRDQAASEVMQYILTRKPIGWGQVYWSLRYASMLSGITTQAANAGGNVSSVVGEVLSTAVKSATEGDPKAFVQAMSGLYKGFGNGWIIAKDTMSNKALKGKFSQPDILEIMKWPGGKFNPLSYAKYVFRFMSATDAFFSGGLKEMESFGLAHEIAKSEGLKGKEVEKRVVEILNNYSETKAAALEQAKKEGLSGTKMKRRAIEIIDQSRPDDLVNTSETYAQYGTFNYKPKSVLGVVSGALDSISEKVPVFRIIVPFSRIIANTINNSLDYTPYGYKRAFLGHFVEGKQFERGSRQYYQQLSRATVGSMAMTALGTLFMGDEGPDAQFDITGAGTGDYKQDAQLEKTRPKYSVKINGNWYSYKNWTSFYIPFLIMGNMKDAKMHGDFSEDEILDRISLAASMSSKSFLDMSFLQGTATFLDAIKDAKKGEKYFKRFIASEATVLVPNLYKQIAKAFDDKVYEANDIPAMIQRNLGITGGLKPKLNVLGEEIEKTESLIPLKPKEITKDPVWKVMAKQKFFMSYPSKQAKINDRFITDDEYYFLIKESGKRIKRYIAEDIGLFNSISQQEFKEDIETISNEIRSEVRYEIEERSSK